MGCGIYYAFCKIHAKDTYIAFCDLFSLGLCLALCNYLAIFFKKEEAKASSVFSIANLAPIVNAPLIPMGIFHDQRSRSRPNRNSNSLIDWVLRIEVQFLHFQDVTRSERLVAKNRLNHTAILVIHLFPRFLYLKLFL